MANEWAHKIGKAWRESAPFWGKNSETVREMFGPITTALLAEAMLERGHRVLDVAGGPGEPTLSVAGEVGLPGRVVHTDLAWDMAVAARSQALRHGYDNVRHALASGDALPFADAAFDRVVCRLGVMFFPDAERGLAEMLRVTRPGGRVALAVWGYKDRNPFFEIPAEISSRYAPSPDPPDAPDTWRFGAPGYLAERLVAAGAVEAGERRVPFQIAGPLDFDRFWAVRVELSDTLRGRVAALSEDERRALADEARTAMAGYFSGESVSIPAEVVVVWATAG